MNYIRKFKKNSKALSPVVASIILIAVTVAVSVVVAAWMGGMTIGLMGSTEQVSISNMQFVNNNNVSPDQIVCLVQNSGGSGSTVINTAYVNGNSYTITSATIVHNSQGNVTVSLPANTLNQNSGTAFTIKFVTAKGTQISSTQTYSP
jgi:archaeal type IV pilus assembly protein PilA